MIDRGAFNASSVLGVSIHAREVKTDAGLRRFSRTMTGRQQYNITIDF
ncbi:hypothetical protein [Neorhodopirellula lusitana]